MFDLFKYELQRFQKYALITFFGYLAILGYLITQKPLLNNTQMQEAIIMLVAVLGGLLFGAAQMWLHKRKSHWTYLVHRPLSTARIYHALAGAGALLIIMVCSLPFLLGTVIVDVFNRELVEARHYWYSLHIAAIALFSYLVGIYTMLNVSWGALFSISALFLMLAKSPTSAMATLLVDFGFILCAYYLSLSSFKVNLSTHFNKKRQLLVASVLMQPGLALAILFSQALFYHIPLTIADNHPDQLKQDQLDGYLSQSWKWEHSEMVREVLEHSNNSLSETRISTLAKQVELAKSGRISIEPKPVQIHGQIFHKDKDYAIDDKATKTSWQFSHNARVIVGRDFYSRKIKGIIGKNGFVLGENALSQITVNDQFETIPSLTADRFIQTHNTLYVVDFVGQYLEVKHQLNNSGEYYTNEVQLAPENDIAILTTNKRIHFFDYAQIQELNSYSEPYLVVNFHRALYDTHYMSYFLLADGILMQFAERDYFGFEQPGIGLVLAKYDGASEVLGERRFDAVRPLPIFIDDQQYWQSPIFMNVIYDYARSHLYPHIPNRYLTAKNYAQRNHNPVANTYSWLFTIIAMIITLLIGRKIKLSHSTLLFWLVFVAICSLPGLVSFMLLNRWRHHVLGGLFSTIRQKSPTTKVAVST